MNKILVIAPHPDDELLGCGGTILKHKKESKDKVYCVYVTNFDKKNKSYKTKLNQIKKVVKKLGFDNYFMGKFNPTKLNQKNLPQVISFLKTIITKIKPTTVYVPFENDIHTDHKVVFDACKPFIKAFRYNFIKNFYAYETISETNFSESFAKENFRPGLYVNITKYIQQKLKVANIYKSEFKKHPFPRSSTSLKSLAVLRGSFCNHKYAESFMILKQIRD